MAAGWRWQSGTPGCLWSATLRRAVDGTPEGVTLLGRGFLAERHLVDCFDSEQY